MRTINRYPMRLLRAMLICLPLFVLAMDVAAQDVQVVLFDEDDAAGDGYREASHGFAADGDELELVNGSKMPVEAEHAYNGVTSGRIEYRHTTGAWDLFIARDGWAEVDISELDSLILYLNGPAAVPGAELPRLGLESNNGNAKSPLVMLSDYLPELDDDPATWQRVSVPFGAFEPFGDFTLERYKTVRFAHGGQNATTRTLWVDYVLAVGDADDVTPPAVPDGVVTRVGDRSVILHWNAGEDDRAPSGYHVYRSTAGGAFERQNASALSAPHFTDVEVENGRPYEYRVRAVNDAGVESADSETVTAIPVALSDEAFLDLVQQTAFDYFWYEANPDNGLVRDRSGNPNVASIAAVGFGLSALAVGVERGWITRAAGAERVLTTLRTFWNGDQGPEASGTIGHRGFFYHFLDMETAVRRGTTELSTVDTALLLGGVLHASSYFDGETPDEEEIRALADSLYRRVDWSWAQVRGDKISHGWRPASGFIEYDWVGYNEAMIVYLLALGSPAHPVEPAAWDAWTDGYGSQWRTQYGYTFLTFPPLFGHQYSHVWVDFRGIGDAYMRSKGIDYFENSRRATLAQRAYAVANPQGHAGYGRDLWGFTASAGPDGYSARGAPPAQGDDGTITPTAPGGSFAFTPGASLAALRTMYDTYRARLWGPYGFRDAFNPGQDWFASDVIGIDQGPILLMIENHRSGQVWNDMMDHPAIRRGLDRAGFREVGTAAEPGAAAPRVLDLSQPYPNPFGDRTSLRYELPETVQVRLVVYDLLGREVAVLLDDRLPSGTATVVFDASRLPAGIYLARLEAAGAARTVRMLHVR